MADLLSLNQTLKTTAVIKEHQMIVNSSRSAFSD